MKLNFELFGNLPAILKCLHELVRKHECNRKKFTPWERNQYNKPLKTSDPQMHSTMFSKLIISHSDWWLEHQRLQIINLSETKIRPLGISNPSGDSLLCRFRDQGARFLVLNHRVRNNGNVHPLDKKIPKFLAWLTR